MWVAFVLKEWPNVSNFMCIGAISQFLYIISQILNNILVWVATCIERASGIYRAYIGIIFPFSTLAQEEIFFSILVVLAFIASTEMGKQRQGI